jgi:hypothetical protein
MTATTTSGRLKKIVPSVGLRNMCRRHWVDALLPGTLVLPTDPTHDLLQQPAVDGPSRPRNKVHPRLLREAVIPVLPAATLLWQVTLKELPRQPSHPEFIPLLQPEARSAVLP